MRHSTRCASSTCYPCSFILFSIIPSYFFMLVLLDTALPSLPPPPRDTSLPPCHALERILKASSAFVVRALLWFFLCPALWVLPSPVVSLSSLPLSAGFAPPRLYALRKIRNVLQNAKCLPHALSLTR